MTRVKSNEGDLILFVIGGCSYSEMRVVHECSKKYGRNIILGML